MSEPSTNVTAAGFHADKLSTVDEFGRRSFAHRVADVLVQQPLGDCLVVSISGEWGAGKSTTMGFVKERLSEVPCRVLEFNPWRFPGEDKLLFALFDGLVKAIDLDGSVLTGWQRVVAGAEHAIEPVASAGALVSEAQMPGTGRSTGNILKSVGNFFRTQLLAGVEKVREQAIAFLEKEKMRVVVLMDDLDRLETDDLMALLRIIKLVADLPNTSFIIAMDEDHVARTIGKRIGGGVGNGRLYLEKIVQVRLPLPVIPWSRMHKYALGLVHQVLVDAGLTLHPDERTRFREVFDEIFAFQIKTPRAAKAWANAVRFSLGVLPDEINTADVVLLECARLAMPKLYSCIRTDIARAMNDVLSVDRQIFGEEPTVEPLIAKLMACFESMPDEDLARKRRVMLNWFPNFRQENWISGADDWERNRRLCSKEYFWRFFSATISSDDLKDAEVMSLIDKATSVENSVEPIVAGISAQLAKESRTAFLRKLGVFGSKEPKALRPLALALSQIPHRSELIDGELGDETAAYTVGTCASLIEAVQDKEERERLESDCLSAASNLMWAWEVRRRMRSTDDTDSNREDKRAVHPSRVLAKRMLSEIESNCPSEHDVFSKYVWTAWHDGDRKLLKSILKTLLAQRSNLDLYLLTSVCSRRTSPTPRPPERCFGWQGEKSLVSLEKLVELKQLTQALESSPIKSANRENHEAESVFDRELSTPEELVGCYFASLEERKRNTASAANDAPSDPVSEN